MSSNISRWYKSGKLHRTDGPAICAYDVLICAKKQYNKYQAILSQERQYFGFDNKEDEDYFISVIRMEAEKEALIIEKFKKYDDCI